VCIFGIKLYNSETGKPNPEQTDFLCKQNSE
jgi:hypothetical protein